MEVREGSRQRNACVAIRGEGVGDRESARGTGKEEEGAVGGGDRGGVEGERDPAVEKGVVGVGSGGGGGGEKEEGLRGVLVGGEEGGGSD